MSRETASKQELDSDVYNVYMDTYRDSTLSKILIQLLKALV